jgi:hypothetical protein
MHCMQHFSNIPPPMMGVWVEPLTWICKMAVLCWMWVSLLCYQGWWLAKMSWSLEIKFNLLVFLTINDVFDSFFTLRVCVSIAQNIFCEECPWQMKTELPSPLQIIQPPPRLIVRKAINFEWIMFCFNWSPEKKELLQHLLHFQSA